MTIVKRGWTAEEEALYREQVIGEYFAPTPEEWEEIVKGLNRYGFDAELAGGGASAVFIAINLPNGQALAFGDVGDHWTANVYASREALDCYENSIGEDVETDVPTKREEGDLLGRHHDPESIADGLLRALDPERFLVVPPAEVCLCGAPMVDGKCSVDGCVCSG